MNDKGMQQADDVVFKFAVWIAHYNLFIAFSVLNKHF